MYKHKVIACFFVDIFVMVNKQKSNCFCMKGIENETVMSSRDRLRDRYAKKYPDRDFTSEESANALDDEVIAELESYDAEIQGYRDNDKKMKDLFNSDPRSGRFLVNWASGGGNPIGYLLDIFGPELKEALESEEGRAKIVDSTNKYLERKAQEEAGESERMANYEQSINDLAAFAQEKGISDEQAIAIFEKVNQIGFDVIDGKYSRESFEMAYNAMNYTTDVETARKEGEVAGKNQKIEEKLAKVEKPIDMPPTVGGQGAGVPETTPKKKRTNMFGL